MPPFTSCYVQEPLDSASSSVESDCDNSILDDSLASSNDSDFSHMQDELDKICDHHLQTSLSSNTMNESDDEQAGVASVCGTRNKKSFFNDLHKVIRLLLGSNIFDTSTSHNSFLKSKPNVIKTLSQKDLKEWITDNTCKYTSCHEH